MELLQRISSRSWRRTRRLSGGLMLMLTLMLCTSTAVAHTTSTCYWGGSTRYYAYARSTDIGNVSGNGAQAGWHEQNYVVWDSFATAYAPFVLSDMWLGFSGSGNWVELGFIRWSGCGGTGNCFFRAKGVNGVITFDQISKTPSGAGTWHTFKIQYSAGTYYVYIDGTSYGGYGGFPSSAVRITIGNEATSNCSTIHTTTYGSSSASSAYAFKYWTGSSWTTWGSATTTAYHPQYHQSWTTYAIKMTTWGP